MASEVQILQPIARVASESTMNFTYQTVIRSCYKPGKILLMLPTHENIKQDNNNRSVGENRGRGRSARVANWNLTG